MIIQRGHIGLYYEKAGAGRPLVMVHGNGEDHMIFDKAAGMLKDRFTCFLLDSRGHGKSSPVKILHYTDMADDVCFLIDKLGLSDVVLYGYSDGGIIGLYAALKCPEITTLIISGANLTPDGLTEDCLSEIRVTYRKTKDPFSRLMLTEPDLSEEQISQITACTLVLAGSEDLVRESETRRIAGAIPGAKRMILEGEDHGSYICHSDKIAKIILDYVAEESE